MTKSQAIPSFRICLVGLAALAVAMGVGRFSFTPILPLMQDDGLLDISGGGLLNSVHFLGYWLGAVFASRLPLAPIHGLRLSLITIGFCTLGMGLTDHFAFWLVFRWLCGVFSALTLVLVSNFYVGYLARIDQASKQGWIFSGVGAGIAIVGLGTLAIMANQVGSSMSWIWFGGMTLFAVFLIWINLGSEIGNQTLQPTQHKSTKSRLIWHIVIPYGAAGFGYIIPATYLPIMARELIQDPLIFGWAWPVFGGAAFLSTLFAAVLQRRLSDRQIWVGSQIIMAAGLVLPVIVPHIASIIVAGICVGGTFMIITMVGIREAHRLAPPLESMRHIAAMTAAFASGQIIGPIFAGIVFDLTLSFNVALIGASGVLMITLFFLRQGRNV